MIHPRQSTIFIPGLPPIIISDPFHHSSSTTTTTTTTTTTHPTTHPTTPATPSPPPQPSDHRSSSTSSDDSDSIPPSTTTFSSSLFSTTTKPYSSSSSSISFSASSSIAPSTGSLSIASPPVSVTATITGVLSSASSQSTPFFRNRNAVAGLFTVVAVVLVAVLVGFFIVFRKRRKRGDEPFFSTSRPPQPTPRMPFESVESLFTTSNPHQPLVMRPTHAQMAGVSYSVPFAPHPYHSSSSSDDHMRSDPSQPARSASRSTLDDDSDSLLDPEFNRGIGISSFASPLHAPKLQTQPWPQPRALPRNFGSFDPSLSEVNLADLSGKRVLKIANA